MPSSLLPYQFGRRIAVITRTAVTVAARSTVTTAEITAIPVTEPAAAFVALTIAVDLAHHCRGTFLVLLDADGNVAQNLFIEPLLPFDLGERSRRRIHVHQREMRLAVLVHPVGEGLYAPLLDLGD